MYGSIVGVTKEDTNVGKKGEPHGKEHGNKMESGRGHIPTSSFSNICPSLEHMQRLLFATKNSSLHTLKWEESHCRRCCSSLSSLSPITSKECKLMFSISQRGTTSKNSNNYLGCC